MLNKQGYLLIDSLLFLKILLIVILYISILTKSVYTLKKRDVWIARDEVMEQFIRKVYKDVQEDEVTSVE